MASLRDTLFLSPPLRRRWVEGLGEWLNGAEIWARELDALERLELVRRQQAVPDDAPEADQAEARLGLMAEVVALAAVDADGRRLFRDGDGEALRRQSPALLERIFLAVVEASGISVGGGESRVEVLEKNSGGTLARDSPGVSPSSADASTGA